MKIAAQKIICTVSFNINNQGHRWVQHFFTKITLALILKLRVYIIRCTL